ncbi:MAG: 50S ribosomal protein L10 [Anaerolineales bacterium]|nr:50S ribosomal protein L10 [Anaerolineales bacterium]
MAITKQRKNELVAQYTEWMNQSKAIVAVEYVGMSMKDIDALRAKVREVGGEFHIVKNTLIQLAFENAGISVESSQFTGSSAIGFAFTDAPALAKAMIEHAKTVEALKIKGGYLDKQPINAEGVKALADLPPLPLMRARLLGTIMAPASKLARTLAEPGRMLAAVMQARVDQAQPA